LGEGATKEREDREKGESQVAAPRDERERGLSL
jgi:hypothetical protein